MYLNRAMRSDECQYDLNRIKFWPVRSPPCLLPNLENFLSLSSGTATDHRPRATTDHVIKKEKQHKFECFIFEKEFNYAYS